MTNGPAFAPYPRTARARWLRPGRRPTRRVGPLPPRDPRHPAVDSPRVRRRRHVARELAADTTLDKSHSHLTAEFSGVPAEQLRDATLLGGLLIAAASAVGFSM